MTSLSPLGTYLVLNDNKDHLKVLKTADGHMLWKEDRYGLPSHFDVQIDQNGDEVLAGVGKTAPYAGKLIKRRLSDGRITVLVDKGYASHTSSRNIRRLGWVYVTYANTNPKYPPYLNEIDAVKLDSSKMERICHIRVNNTVTHQKTSIISNPTLIRHPMASVLFLPATEMPGIIRFRLT
jgi:hypothetical protein